MHFGELLKQAREKAGLSQSELAARSGVSLRTIQGWERGGRSPVSSDFFQVVKALGVEAGYFAAADDRRKPTPASPKKAKGKK